MKNWYKNRSKKTKTALWVALIVILLMSVGIWNDYKFYNHTGNLGTEYFFQNYVLFKRIVPLTLVVLVGFIGYGVFRFRKFYNSLGTKGKSIPKTNKAPLPEEKSEQKQKDPGRLYQALASSEVVTDEYAQVLVMEIETLFPHEKVSYFITEKANSFLDSDPEEEKVKPFSNVLILSIGNQEFGMERLYPGDLASLAGDSDYQLMFDGIPTWEGEHILQHINRSISK